jgi:hypothetical protein
MAKDAGAIHVALDANVFVADVGADEPDNTWDFATDSLEDIGWRELGWNTKDGVTLTFSRTTVNIEGQGSLDPLRILVTGAPKTVALTLEQLSFGVWDFATGGAESNTLAPGLYELLPLPPSTLAERALAFLFTDGDEHVMPIYRRGIVTGDTAIPFTDGGAAVVPVTFSILTPADQSEAYRVVHDIDALAFEGS